MPLLNTGGGSISPAIPLSQQKKNTAEVREFRCLFTHDVRRKAKRWHDGFLTFHTFNSRAVVYDELRNRVGDTYTSPSEAVAEGTELTLQQGVLVEVGEPKGSREQDVSQVIVAREGGAGNNSGVPNPAARRNPAPLLSRRGVMPSSVNSSEATRLEPRVLAPQPVGGKIPGPAQLWKPKSLKEVLNTPSGSMGRARPLDQSLFERRQGNLSGLQNERQPLQVCRLAGHKTSEEENIRPKKRQRIQDERNEVLAEHQTKKTPEKPPHKKSQVPASRNQQTVPRRGARVASPILVESDEESSQLSPMITPIFPRVSSPRPREKPPPKETPTKKTAESKANETKKRRKRKNSLRQESSRPSQTTTMTSPTRIRPLQERPANILRASSNGRRKKLMYKDLLPKGFEPKKLDPKSQLDNSQQTLAKQMPNPVSVLEKQSSHSEGSVQDGTEEGARDVSLSMEMDSDLDEVFRDYDAQMAEATERSASSPLPQPPPRPTGEQENGLASVTTGPAPNPPEGMVRASSPAPAPLVDPSSLTQPPLPPPLSPPQVVGRPPALPEARAPVAAAVAAAAPPPPSIAAPAVAAKTSQFRSPLKRITSAPAPESPRQKGHLQKSFSDMSAMINRPRGAGGNGGGDEDGDDDDEQDNDRGPWSREAFDLFGWRPGDAKGVVGVR